MDILITRLLITVVLIAIGFWVWTHPVSVRRMWNQKLANTFGVQNKTTESAKQYDSFVLADCSFDVILDFTKDSFDLFQKNQAQLAHAQKLLPGVSNNAFVILEIYQNDLRGSYARLLLHGPLQGTDGGLISGPLEDRIDLIYQEQQIRFWHKRPILEDVSKDMVHIVVGKQYSMHFSASPGFAIPLIPKQINIRTHEGVVYTITNFMGPDKGWYLAKFSF